MTYEIRSAKPEDSFDLAKLSLVASDGVMESIYHDLIPDKATYEIIERRFHVLGSIRSYENCWVAAQEDSVLGFLHAFAMDDAEQDLADPLVPEERYAVTAPFGPLDAYAAGTFHINMVATFEEHRGRGIGTALMQSARDLAQARALNTLSLLVFEENKGALALYQRLGFREAARQAAVPDPYLKHGGDILLLTAPV